MDKKRKSFKNRRKKQEYDTRILDVARVTRVVAGGRRFSFRISAIMGDHKGRIGLGVKKGHSVKNALEKAKKQAKKNLIKIPLTKDKTIPQEIEIKFKSAHLLLKPRLNKLVAGGVVRIMAQVSGIKSMTGKIIGTNNKLNNARAFIKAMKMLGAK